MAGGSGATYSGEVAPSRDRGPLRPRAPTVPLPSARLRVLRAVARHEPATTAELSRALGGHENTTRQHLEALTRDGLVQGEQNRGGMGRPSVSYSLSPSGLVQLASRSASPEHAALVASLADHLVETDDHPAARARTVGLAWGARLAADADHVLARGVDPADAEWPPEADTADADTHAVAEAVQLLDALGFSPLVVDDSTRPVGDRGGADLLLRTCPLLDAALARPDVVCRVHEGLVEGFLRARGSQADVTVEPFAARLGCRAVIRT